MSIQAPASVAPVAGKASDQAQARISQPRTKDQVAFIEQLKRLYSTDQQAEYLFLQAEADSLLVQLEQVKAVQQPSA